MKFILNKICSCGYSERCDKYTPSGFVFFTNMNYGSLYTDNDVVEYQKLIKKLWDNGYIVQSTEATDYKNREFPLKQNIAINIKREDGKEVVMKDVWDVVDKE
jgi:hypothetical protein